MDKQNEIEMRNAQEGEMEIDLLELLLYYRDRLLWIILGFWPVRRSRR